MSDQLANGRRFRLLKVIDDFNSECLATIPDFCLSGLRVIRELDAFMAQRCNTALLRVTQPEQVPSHLLCCRDRRESAIESNLNRFIGFRP